MTIELPPWMVEHRRAWNTKAGLRIYYEREYFSRILSMLPKGRSLEIGAGPGFFADYHRATVVIDIILGPHLDVVADVHDLPFESNLFSAVIGINVLHHLRDPLRSLKELARVLTPQGRLILIEPWTTPVGRLFYRHVHYEDCFAILDPLHAVFPASKDPMAGNAEIPHAYLESFAGQLSTQTGLCIGYRELFGLFGFLATGGFRRVYFGDFATRAMIHVDRMTPHFLRKLIALKAFVVAEKG
jgi:SAM-dependent methyltransferase